MWNTPTDDVKRAHFHREIDMMRLLIGRKGIRRFARINLTTITNDMIILLVQESVKHKLLVVSDYCCCCCYYYYCCCWWSYNLPPVNGTNCADRIERGVEDRGGDQREGRERQRHRDRERDEQWVWH